MNSTLPFHPAVSSWFTQAFAAPTDAQQRAWRAIRSGSHALIAAPTGSGKTLAAFLSAIDELVREGVDAPLPDETRVVYVSPLKALSNDIQRNLEIPLAGIRTQLQRLALPNVDVRALVRTGDTPQAERASMRKRPPHILVTTPESLYLLLTSASGRDMLGSTRTVIVDEIHAVAGSKRGAHLALSLERLAALADKPMTRIGLSATQKPIEDIAKFLVGESGACRIVDSGYVRQRDLALVVPPSPLEAVMSTEVWAQVYEQLADLIRTHRTTLIFVNTRRMAERATRHLSERLGKDNVASHHGSLAKEQRLDAEQRLKRGTLKALVATASLELGIDIGDVDLVCQLGSPRSIATFLQRVGRSGHTVGATPKGRLFPLSRDELVECVALLEAVRRGELDRLIIPEQPLDVLSQQLIAEVASSDGWDARVPRGPGRPRAAEWTENELFALVTRAFPYRHLTRAQFDSVVRMVSEGFSTRHGQRSAYLHRDAVNHRLRARKGARLTAVTSGGAIPDTADYQVLLEPTQTAIGTVNEDFAVESMSGDVFQLGNHSYRVLRIEPGRMRVEDAQGAPPTIPFWLGEAPARTDELSGAVSALRARLEGMLHELSAGALERAIQWVKESLALEDAAARQLVDYLAAAKGVLGVLPTQDTLVLERFFDESGGMQLVLHSPYGSRINRAFGLALRKRFCRKFNFELQAAATDDAIVLSLGETHSFPLDEVPRYLNSRSVRDVLIQAMLTAPLFAVRWRWNASIALAVRRFQGGKKRPAPLQRMDAEDLISVVFPDQIACPENLAGEREIPDHPLIQQTIADCLHEAMDIDGLIALLRAIESGDKRVIARDLPHPSPLAQEILNAKPYAFLDDAPLEERRTQAVMSRRWLDPTSSADIGRLDPAAIQKVREEAWPAPENADELHEALMSLGVIAEQEGAAWVAYFNELATEKRATRVSNGETQLWAAAELLPLVQAIYPTATLTPPIETPLEYRRAWSADQALIEILRNRLQGLGPTTAVALAAPLGVPISAADAGLRALEAEGFALRGQFTGETTDTEWCERRLLARIHRYTIKTLRAEIQPVSAADFLRFLFEWQGLTVEPRPEGAQALLGVIEQLEGWQAPAGVWESDILPARVQDYDPQALDRVCLAGRVVWSRLIAGRSGAAGPVRATPVALLTRAHLPLWQGLIAARRTPPPSLSHPAQAVAAFLRDHGASFFDEIVAGTRLLKSQAEEALGELVAQGAANADSFSGLRALLIPADRRRAFTGGRRRRLPAFGIEEAGRWSLIGRVQAQGEGAAGTEPLEETARVLLRRYGVIFRCLLEREGEWLPPWYELLRALRRLEARGDVRGGRFVAGFSGEHYALPEAVGALREQRRRAGSGKFVAVSAADPLNLVGILTPGPRVPSLAANRVLYRDGIPVAVHVGGDTQFLSALDASAQWEARNALVRHSGAGMRAGRPS